MVPLAWYPRLLEATAEQRRRYEIAGGGYGLHWPDLDEDLGTEGLLRGAPAPAWQGWDCPRQVGFDSAEAMRKLRGAPKIASPRKRP